MTIEEAKRILNPSTTIEALAEIEYYAGFNGEKAKIEAVNEACLVACEALEKQMPKKPKQNINNAYCPNCKDALGKTFAEIALTTRYNHFCPYCGQALDWSE